MSGATECKGESPSNVIDERTEFDKGFQAGLAQAYRQINAWSDARLGRLDPGKNKKMRDEIDRARLVLLRYIRAGLPTRHYPEFWK